MNYKETSLAGTSWVRCQAIVITNPLAGTEDNDPRTGLPVGPTAHFTEEKVVTMEGADLRIPAGSCSKPFNPTDTITLLDPATGEPTGEIVTHAALYGILFSLYMQTAVERDTTNPP
jgi:hypothetical protein